MGPPFGLSRLRPASGTRRHNERSEQLPILPRRFHDRSASTLCFYRYDPTFITNESSSARYDNTRSAHIRCSFIVFDGGARGRVRLSGRDGPVQYLAFGDEANGARAEYSSGFNRNSSFLS